MLADFSHLSELPLTDKVRLVEMLWDNIVKSEEAFPLQEWQRAEIELRLAEVQQDPSSSISRSELWQRVDESRG